MAQVSGKLCILLLYGLNIVCAGNVGDTCSTDRDCTQNSTTCVRPYDSCELGECVCRSGFTLHNDVCKRDVSLGIACDNSTKCTQGSACIDGVCTCPSNGSINAVLQRCMAGDVKFVGEQCLKDTDCYTNNIFLMYWGYLRCEAESETSTTKICKCHMHTDGNLCRYPTLFETCHPTTGICRPPIRVNEFIKWSGQTDEQCIDGKCQCPSTSTLYVLKYKDQLIPYCKLLRPTIDLPVGAMCQESPACRSGICGRCPGQTFNICIDEDMSSESTKWSSGSILVPGLLVMHAIFN